ncbi:unnamed protein product [Arabis nemorensis]|uniref:Uncharacterized protein n=1 Tax=Arabis nemorensis TaxID=586526 RepID=A0A565BKB3_9BRAS|nr:unnamed protein product [Arabis nemorensis]
MLGVHLHRSENEEAYNNDVPASEIEEHGPSSFPPENPNRRVDDDNLLELSRSPSRSTIPRTPHSPCLTRTSSAHARNSSTWRTHMRRVNFEAQVDRRFQRMEESRGELLNVVRLR